MPPHFPFLRAKSHFHATYYFAHNCCTISLSLSMICNNIDKYLLKLFENVTGVRFFEPQCSCFSYVIQLIISCYCFTHDNQFRWSTHHSASWYMLGKFDNCKISFANRFYHSIFADMLHWLRSPCSCCPCLTTTR